MTGFPSYKYSKCGQITLWILLNSLTELFYNSWQLTKLTMMKDGIDTSRQRRLIARSYSRRNVSKSRHLSRLDGVRFLKPSLDVSNKENDRDSPVKSALAKALAERNSLKKSENKKRKSNSAKKNDNEKSSEAQYGQHQTINVRNPTPTQTQKSGGISQKYYDKLTQFSLMQDKIREIEGKIEGIRSNMKSSGRNDHGSYIRQIETRGENGQIIRTAVLRDMSSSAKFLPWIIQKRQEKIEKPEKKQKAIQKQTTQNTDISNFITQVPEPQKLLQCSSQTNMMTFTHKDVNIPRFKYYISTIVSAFMSEANTSFMQLCRSHLVSCIKQLQGAKKTQRPTMIKNFHRLPPSRKLNTIVFDLDETLIHCNQKPEMPHDVMLPFIFPTGQNIKLGINVRPFAQECLKELSEYFEIIVFTASHQCYGHIVTDYLDPQNQYVSFKYFRDSCVKTPQGYIKDLRVIDRPLSNMLLVDNAAFSYAFQVQNGVPVVPYYDCKADCQLRHLTNYLKSMHNSPDIRTEHCNNMKTHTYGEFNDPIDLLNRTYPEHMLF